LITKFVSSRKIKYAYKNNGFFSAIVEGPRGIGKSSYSLKVLHDIYSSNGYDNDEAWRMALDRTLFEIKDIINFLDKSLRSENREIAMIWDDAGVHASNLDWFVNIRQVKHLQALMDTIRGSVSGLLMTAPNQGGLLKFIRRYDNFILQIIYDPRGGEYRICKGYIKRSLPSGKQLVFSKFRDYYRCRLPQWVYEEYCKKRDKYTVHSLDSLKKLGEKKYEKHRGNRGN